jgi:hypothetical protein
VQETPTGATRQDLDDVGVIQLHAGVRHGVCVWFSMQLTGIEHSAEAVLQAAAAVNMLKLVDLGVVAACCGPLRA